MHHEEACVLLGGVAEMLITTCSLLALVIYARCETVIEAEEHVSMMSGSGWDSLLFARDDAPPCYGHSPLLRRGFVDWP